MNRILLTVAFAFMAVLTVRAQCSSSGNNATTGHLDVGGEWVNGVNDGYNGGFLNLVNKGTGNYWHLTMRSSDQDKFQLLRWSAASATWLTPLTVTQDGRVGNGTSSPDAKLTVAGNVHAREVKVSIAAGADFVFEEDYKLQPLQETEAFIKKHKHLPGISSAKEMEAEGEDKGRMNILLLQKIEELTLHLIEMEKELNKMKEQNSRLLLVKER